MNNPLGRRGLYITGNGKCVIFINGNLPRKGVLFMLQQIFTLIVAPIIVGLVIELVSRWLDEKDDD